MAKKKLNEFEEKYNKYQNKDPFPDIEPALLNSADIYDYIDATGMLYPFYKENLKPASYSINFLGNCIYWDKDVKREVNVQKGDKFLIRSDSIAFVTLEPQFQLPYYIAARFNFKIDHIYKGLLLGTGPLVDPGFVGKLSVPIHNLTTNDYELRGGEPLIWMEFTKISRYLTWDPPKFPISKIGGKYVIFPKRKKNLKLIKYLHQAAPYKSIQSSIPRAIDESKKLIEEGNYILKRNALIGFGAAIGIVAIVAGMLNLINTTNSTVNSAAINNTNMVKDIESLKRENDFFKNKYLEVKNTLDSIRLREK